MSKLAVKRMGAFAASKNMAVKRMPVDPTVGVASKFANVSLAGPIAVKRMVLPELDDALPPKNVARTGPIAVKRIVLPELDDALPPILPAVSPEPRILPAVSPEPRFDFAQDDVVASLMSPGISMNADMIFQAPANASILNVLPGDLPMVPTTNDQNQAGGFEDYIYDILSGASSSSINRSEIRVDEGNCKIIRHIRESNINADLRQIVNSRTDSSAVALAPFNNPVAKKLQTILETLGRDTAQLGTVLRKSANNVQSGVVNSASFNINGHTIEINKAPHGSIQLDSYDTLHISADLLMQIPAAKSGESGEAQLRRLLDRRYIRVN